jgi:putative endonuclease
MQPKYASPAAVMAAQAAIHEKSFSEVSALYYQPQEQKAWIYLLASQPNGILYLGVTNDLARRTYEHREGKVAGFTKKYDVKNLVYYEGFPSMTQAIAREKAMKNWTRAWKVRRILAVNPAWRDLYSEII